ncbi:purine nucleoside phosphorylase DeoD-type [Mycoplasmopsis caviae]|uniref:Uridine phosphorylase n=1 Tax=Mycoplasmopsis caviae TaxID=55603 RepID=A0A3P8MF74_9BACT|nr:purine nucleoside phosphorylase DeoD-type [Mycoplasmopsis caviae]UUD35390.1 purine nucleoside phosphorylase DeoD-type [Mycoplasmopsis caviae]VDR41833.1 purine-nucleoside phosphorylase [Mycoplasmopsis caviae]
MSTHIGAKKGEIARVCFLSGDPLRSKFMAYKYLKNVKEVSNVRNETYFTGEYNDIKVTFGGHGMGMFSIGAYAHELFNEYDVDVIIRLGSTGSYYEQYNVMDTVIIDRAFSDNVSIAQLINNENVHEYFPSKEVTDELVKVAKKLGKKAPLVSVHSTDVFYATRPLEETKRVSGCQVVEAESYALFAEAKRSGKKAATILQISDSLAKMEFTDSLTRETKFTDMFEIALESLKNL